MPIVVNETTAPTVTGLGISGGYLTPTSSALKRIYHRARGFKYGDVAVTIRHRVNTTAPGADYQAGVIARRLDSANQIVAYVTNATLVLRKRDGDAMTDLIASVAITALAANTDYWLRLICDANTLRAEHWLTEPTPMGVPWESVTVTLAAADIAKFGTGIEGEAGIWWQPGAGFANARIDSFRAEPYTYRNRALPQAVALGGRIPGDLPALTDLHVTPSGGANPPIWGLVGWARRPNTGPAPLGIIEAESATSMTGFAAAIEAGARGGSDIRKVGGGAVGGAAWWTVDSSLLEDDDATVEVFARLAALGSNWILRADPGQGTSYGQSRYSDRGSSGLTPANRQGWQFVRLGRIRLTGKHLLRVDATWTDAETAFLDYLVLVPARAFASSPSGVTLTSSYPRFVPTVNETTRILLADGDSLIRQPGFPAIREHGLGRRIELPPGQVDLVAKLSSLIADRPETTVVTEQLAHNATVRASILPRYAFA